MCQMARPKFAMKLAEEQRDHFASKEMTDAKALCLMVVYLDSKVLS